MCGAIAQRVDLLRHGSHRSLHAGDRQVRHKLFGGRAGDEVNLFASQAIRMITLGVVPMKVRVDDVPNRLFRNFPLDLVNERSGRRRLGVRVDHDHILRPDEDGGIAVQHGLGTRMSEVNAVGHFLHVEQLGVGARGRCAGPCCAMVSQFQNRGPSQGTPHQHPKEVAASGMAIAGDMIVCMGMRVFRCVRVAVRMIDSAVLCSIGQTFLLKNPHYRFWAAIYPK